MRESQHPDFVKFSLGNIKKKEHHRKQKEMSVQSSTDQEPPSPPQLAFPIQPWETEADALNLHGDHRLLFRVLRGFHEFSLEQNIEGRGLFEIITLI